MLNEQSQAKVAAYANYLRDRQRKHLSSKTGMSNNERRRMLKNVDQMPDRTMMDTYKHCVCGAPFYSDEEELRAILECDSPEAAYEMLGMINHHGG